MRRNVPRIGARERLDRQRLGKPRHALDQQMPLREDRDQHALEKVVLPDDHLLHFVEDALHERSDFLAVQLVVNHDILS